MHVIACPNHPPVISWPHEFQHLLLFVLGWRKVNWELHVGWRLRVACMWLCVPYFSPLFFALANGFRFIAIPWHECHCLFCLPFPPFELAIGFRFSISLRSWDTGSATPCEDDHVTKKIRPNPSN